MNSITLLRSWLRLACWAILIVIPTGYQDAIATWQGPEKDHLTEPVTSIQALQLEQYASGIRQVKVDISAQLTYAEAGAWSFFVQDGRRATMIYCDQKTSDKLASTSVGTRVRIIGEVGDNGPFIQASRVEVIASETLEPTDLSILDEQLAVPINGFASAKGRVREILVTKYKSLVFCENGYSTVMVAYYSPLTEAECKNLLNKTVKVTGALVKPNRDFSTFENKLLAMGHADIQFPVEEEIKWPLFDLDQLTQIRGKVVFSNGFDRVAVKSENGTKFVLTQQASEIVNGMQICTYCKAESQSSVYRSVLTMIIDPPDDSEVTTSLSDGSETLTGEVKDIRKTPLVTYLQLQRAGDAIVAVLPHDSQQSPPFNVDVRIGDEIQVVGHAFRRTPYVFDPIASASLDGGIFLKELGSVEIISRPFTFSQTVVTLAVLTAIAMGLVTITWNSTLRRAVNRRTVKLNEANKSLNVALDALTKALLLFDGSSRLSCANELASRLFARRPNIGDSESELISSLAEANESAELHSVLDRRLQSIEFDYSTRVSIRGRVWEVYTAPVRPTNGAVVGRVWTFEDVSSKVRLEQGLLETQKMELLGRLAGSHAHDYGNLLGVIQACCTELEAKIGNSQLVKEPISNLGVSVSQAIRINNQLMDFARHSELEIEKCDIRRVIESATQLYKSVLGRNVELRVEVPEEPLLAMVDRGRLEQAIINLLSNSRDSISNDGIILICADRFSSEPGEECIRVSVIDNGCGMDSYTLERAAEPFFTTKARGKGTGLGLSSAKKLLENLGGHIEVESTVGLGSRVSLVIPLAIEELCSELQTNFRTRITVVEACNSTARNLTSTLHSLGYTPDRILESELEERAFDVNGIHEIFIVGIDSLTKPPVGVIAQLRNASPSASVVVYSYHKFPKNLIAEYAVGRLAQVSLLCAPFKMAELQFHLKNITFKRDTHNPALSSEREFGQEGL